MRAQPDSSNSFALCLPLHFHFVNANFCLIMSKTVRHAAKVRCVFCDSVQFCSELFRSRRRLDSNETRRCSCEVPVAFVQSCGEFKSVGRVQWKSPRTSVQRFSSCYTRPGTSVRISWLARACWGSAGPWLHSNIKEATLAGRTGLLLTQTL